VSSGLALKIPPALLMLLFGALMWGLDWLVPGLRWPLTGHDWLAGVIMMLAVGLILAGIISFRLANTTVDPVHPEKASAVVSSGVYRYTRNPMYLGFLLMLLAMAVKLTNPLSLVLPVLFVWYMNRFQIIPEEHALEQLFAEEYRQYRQRVRRWL
jgi:protein-S-isoprenylcysteine O-methyltransferase Ste14